MKIIKLRLVEITKSENFICNKNFGKISSSQASIAITTKFNCCMVYINIKIHTCINK